MLSPRDYDEAITIFSPEGRLYQVEYAIELVKRGAPILGISSCEGVVLAASERLERPLQDPKYNWKIFQLDEHMGVAIAGLSSDARVLIEQARIFCQQNRMIYDESASVESIAKLVGDQAQIYTQYAGVRPFGVSLIIGGVDQSGSRVMATDPSGSYRVFKAIAIGRKSDEANKLLDERYHDDITLKDSIKLAFETIGLASEEKEPLKNIKVAVIPSKNPIFRRLSFAEVEEYLK
ncbi:archaeal proteasome endopeptidase complex subunit alpha [Candidatus Bathyarchaeota archaeon]|nr:archaeal proteasome endopeptidase complex subunit alpha [Candidatus Bathyarchaeota archaeon]MBS7630527.1 archaeal proteasome endopeptidase complex subunit alpha [Candidatus Bathyarchaeota archaeon]